MQRSNSHTTKEEEKQVRLCMLDQLAGILVRALWTVVVLMRDHADATAINVMQ